MWPCVWFTYFVIKYISTTSRSCYRTVKRRASNLVDSRFKSRGTGALSKKMREKRYVKTARKRNRERDKVRLRISSSHCANTGLYNDRQARRRTRGPAYKNRAGPTYDRRLRLSIGARHDCFSRRAANFRASKYWHRRCFANQITFVVRDYQS